MGIRGEIGDYLFDVQWNPDVSVNDHRRETADLLGSVRVKMVDPSNREGELHRVVPVDPGAQGCTVRLARRTLRFQASGDHH